MNGCAATNAIDRTVDGTRSALIVASSDYADAGLRRLHAPSSDARALAVVLHDPEIGGFEVRTLLNEPAHEVNLAVEEFFSDRQPDDLLLVHFSCHGVKDEAGELYFAMANTRLRRLGATAVAADFVNRRMNRSRSRRVVLLLDCCYAGAFERGMTARAGGGVAIEAQFGGRGRAVITASSSMEYAFEEDELADVRELAPSVFTSALVEGLETGEADRDQDGLVALDELYDYVYDKVRASTPNQTPGKWTFGVQGELVIARRARPVTSPAQLPRELEEAIDSPFAAVRTAAVQELARLLRGRHAGLALAARLALDRLTDDDSRTVANAATAALTGQPKPPVPPKLKLLTTMVDFGRLSLHSESPERRVRFENAGGGSLNVRAAAQANWLKVRQDGEELVVSVDTSTAGQHDSVIIVDSDGGSAAIGVQVHVVPDVPTQEDTGTYRGTIPTETPGESAASMSAPAAKPSAAATADARRTPADHENASPIHPPKAQPVGAATQEVKTSPGGGGTPTGQPRHPLARGRILFGVGVGIVLIVLLVVLIRVLTSSPTTSPPTGAGNPTTSPPTGAGNPTPSPASLFREDFSGTANRWSTVGQGASGRYSNGTYQISSKGQNTYGFAAPKTTSAPRLNPAPQNITIKVTARQITGGDNLNYGIACRSDDLNNNAYYFEISNGYAGIYKYVNNNYKILAESSTAPVHANGINQLQATCASVGGQSATRLVFWVNGQKVFDKTDQANPLTNGKVGLFAFPAANYTKTVTAEFDNFVVTQA
jgi:Caspase domain